MNFKDWLREMALGTAQTLGQWDKFTPEKKRWQDSDLRQPRGSNFPKPVDHHAVGGDQSHDQGWDKASYNIITQTDPKFEKLRNRFQNVKQTFDIYFVKTDKAHPWAEKGEVQEDFLPRLGIKPPSINRSNITVFFTQNFAGGHVPMTPWTVGHRFAHSIQMTDVGYWQFQHTVGRDFQVLLSKIYDVNQNDPTDVGDYHKSVSKDKKNFRYVGNPDIDKDQNEYDKLYRQITQAFGSMRSAREGNLDRPGEFVHELLGQFILNGKIHFRKENLPDLMADYPIITKGSEKDTYEKTDRNKFGAKRTAGDELESMANKYNEMCNDILNRCVGKIFIM